MGLLPIQLKASLNFLNNFSDCNFLGRKIVLIELKGGNDGLNTIIPINVYDEYMDLNLDSLNESSNHYKEKLNKKANKKFESNFSFNNSSHLKFLANICKINLTVRDIVKSTNTFSVDGFKKTIFSPLSTFCLCFLKDISSN